MSIDYLLLIKEFKDLLVDGYIHFFIIAALFDIATGMAKGLVKKQANSTNGLLGVVKHMLVVMLVLVVYPYMRFFGLSYFAVAFVLFYIAVYTISIIENLSVLGVPFPQFVKERIEKLKDENDNGI